MKLLSIILIFFYLFNNSEARECATLFSECNFQGQSYQICDDSPNPNLNESPFKDIPIKSVDIPFGSKLKLYCGIDFKGSFFVYETSQSCINQTFTDCDSSQENDDVNSYVFYPDLSGEWQSKVIGGGSVIRIVQDYKQHLIYAFSQDLSYQDQFEILNQREIKVTRNGFIAPIQKNFSEITWSVNKDIWTRITYFNQSLIAQDYVADFSGDWKTHLLEGGKTIKIVQDYQSNVLSAFTENLSYKDQFQYSAQTSNSQIQVLRNQYVALLSENYSIIFWPFNYEYWIRQPSLSSEILDQSSLFVGKFPDLAGDWSTLLIGNQKPVKIVQDYETGHLFSFSLDLLYRDQFDFIIDTKISANSNGQQALITENYRHLFWQINFDQWKRLSLFYGDMGGKNNKTIPNMGGEWYSFTMRRDIKVVQDYTDNFVMAFTDNLGYRDQFDILSNTKLRVKNTVYESYISENLTLIFWPANWDYWIRKSTNYYDKKKENQGKYIDLSGDWQGLNDQKGDYTKIIQDYDNKIIYAFSINFRYRDNFTIITDTQIKGVTNAIAYLSDNQSFILWPIFSYWKRVTFSNYDKSSDKRGKYLDIAGSWQSINDQNGVITKVVQDYDTGYLYAFSLNLVYKDTFQVYSDTKIMCTRNNFIGILSLDYDYLLWPQISYWKRVTRFNYDYSVKQNSFLPNLVGNWISRTGQIIILEQVSQQRLHVYTSDQSYNDYFEFQSDSKIKAISNGQIGLLTENYTHLFWTWGFEYWTKQ